MKPTEAHQQLLLLAQSGTLLRDEDPAAIDELIAAGLLREVTAAFESGPIFVQVKVCRLTPAGVAALERRPS